VRHDCRHRNAASSHAGDAQYRTNTSNGDEVYLKLTVIDDVLIVSFKEL